MRQKFGSRRKLSRGKEQHTCSCMEEINHGDQRAQGSESHRKIGKEPRENCPSVTDKLAQIVKRNKRSLSLVRPMEHGHEESSQMARGVGDI